MPVPENATQWSKSKAALGWWALFALVLQEGISFAAFKNLLAGPEGDLSDAVNVAGVALATLPFTAVAAYWCYRLWKKDLVGGAATLMWATATLFGAGVLSNMATELPSAVVQVQGIENVTVNGPSSIGEVLGCYLQTYGSTLFLLAAAAAVFFGYVAKVWDEAT